MKSHPKEYKDKYGVDPKEIEALNVPNPRNKRPYFRRQKAGVKTEIKKENSENTENHEANNKEKDGNIIKSRKKSTNPPNVIEIKPKAPVPRAKKDRLRPMPPHLLAKLMAEEAERERQIQEEEETRQRQTQVSTLTRLLQSPFKYVNTQGLITRTAVLSSRLSSFLCCPMPFLCSIFPSTTFKIEELFMVNYARDTQVPHGSLD